MINLLSYASFQGKEKFAFSTTKQTGTKYAIMSWWDKIFMECLEKETKPRITKTIFGVLNKKIDKL